MQKITQQPRRSPPNPPHQKFSNKDYCNSEIFQVFWFLYPPKVSVTNERHRAKLCTGIVGSTFISPHCACQPYAPCARSRPGLWAFAAVRGRLCKTLSSGVPGSCRSSRRCHVRTGARTGCKKNSTVYVYAGKREHDTHIFFIYKHLSTRVATKATNAIKIKRYHLRDPKRSKGKGSFHYRAWASGHKRPCACAWRSSWVLASSTSSSSSVAKRAARSTWSQCS